MKSESKLHSLNCPGKRVQRGVTLAILLWFLAALSLLAATIMYTARVDIKMAQMHRQQAEVEALGDGAIQLALADLQIAKQQGEYSGRGLFSRQYELAGSLIAVNLVPVSGLVSINRAPPELLAALLIGAVDIAPDYAQELAKNVVEWRSPADAGLFENATLKEADDQYGARNGRFEAPEDLLMVPGINREIFEQIKDLVYVAQQEQPGVDWLSAPVSLIMALGGLDERRARQVSELRGEGSLGAVELPADVDTRFQEDVASSSMRADALVPAPDRQFIRQRWVNTAQAGADGLPWSFFRTQAARVAGG